MDNSLTITDSGFGDIRRQVENSYMSINIFRDDKGSTEYHKCDSKSRHVLQTLCWDERVVYVDSSTRQQLAESPVSNFRFNVWVVIVTVVSIVSWWDVLHWYWV